jgi:hypothetical protein
LLLGLIASASSLVGLLAIWAALSRRHWFVRAAAVGGLICSLAVVPAYALVQIFLAEVTCVVVPLVGGRLWRERRFSFRLADLFLITVVVASVVLLAKNAPKPVLQLGYLGWGAACGYAALAGLGAWKLAGRKWLRASLLAGLPLAAAAIGPFSWLFLWDAPIWFWYAALPLLAVVVWACLSLFGAQKVVNARQWSAARLTLAALFIALMVLPTVAYYQMIFPTPAPVATLPNPNAYVELTQIGEYLNRKNPADYHQQLEAARKALDHDSLVPVTYAPNDLHLAPHAELRALLRYWGTEGRAAETDGRYDEACETYLDLIRAGAKTGRGGLFVEWILSGLFVKDGAEGIQRVRGRLSASKSRQTCVELRSLETTLQGVEASLEREYICAQHAYGWHARIRFLPMFDLDTEVNKRIEAHRLAVIRLLECDLAMRCFQHERGTWPAALDELVPEFLPTVPLDPFTGRPLIYRRQADGFLLYSTGPDQIDNGGIPTSSEIPAPGEDLLLTTEDAPEMPR